MDKNKRVDILSRYKYDQNIITIIKQMVDACNEFLIICRELK